MAGPLPIGDPAPVDGRLPADLPVDASVPFSAYLHVPFCRVRCGYCDFNTYTSGELRGARQDEYADTLGAEIALARRVLGDAGALRPMDTVFFGGGPRRSFQLATWRGCWRPRSQHSASPTVPR